MGDNEDILHLILCVNGKLEKPFEDFFRGEFTTLQLNVLCTLYTGGPTTVSELAAGLHAPRQQISKLVEKLYEDGRILRCHDTRDRRKVLIAVSENTARHISARREKFLQSLNEALQNSCREECGDFQAAVETINRVLAKIPLSNSV